MENDYPRNMIGYGQNPPHPKWPHKARIAIQFVINYEEGAENNILHGDAASEAFLSEIVGAPAYKGMRHINMESIYEYGSRAGFWRLHRLFTKMGLPVTVFAVAMAMQRNIEAIKAMQDADWEIASHGLRWIDYQYFSEEDERAHFEMAMDIHKQITGEYPEGWYLGRASPNTHKILASGGEFSYLADSYADDLPYWDGQFETPQLFVPYTLDSNDMRFATSQGFNSGDQFFSYLKDAFDILYEEGLEAPKMLSIGLHCRLIGRPGRLASLKRFLEYIVSHNDVWVARRVDIAKHWRALFPYGAQVDI